MTQKLSWKQKTANRGIAAAVVMAIDVDGRRGIFSSDGQNAVWAASFEECWARYIRRETKLAKAQAAEKEATVIESDNAEPITPSISLDA